MRPFEYDLLPGAAAVLRARAPFSVLGKINSDMILCVTIYWEPVATPQGFVALKMVMAHAAVYLAAECGL